MASQYRTQARQISHVGNRPKFHIKSGSLLGSLALTIALGAISLQARANPVNPVVVHGHASFNGGVPGQLEITNQPGTIINWQDFSIGRGELTRFIQQGSLSAVLNRVTGFNTSEILGQLQSNGRVFLINPNGIVFGEGSVIDTAGLVASTLDLSNDDFLSGNYNFAGDASSGDIVNRGFITSGRNGEIVLLAPKVENHGVLKVEEGQILLAAGERISLTSLDSEHISFDIEASPGEVLNLGKILADGGSAALVAASLTNTGVIQADSIGSDANGSLWLEATESANIGGTLSASGTKSDLSGGEITITAPELAFENANIQTVGYSGGGDIRLGGDYQGSRLGGGAANARTVNIDKATRINADALSDGNGGTVIVWSDDHTVVNGQLSARGGQFGGDGGLVETSSAGILEFAGPASVSAVNGKPGTWLLDPEDIVIGSGEADSISAALNEGSSVSIKTSDGGDGEGNISVNAAIAKTEGGDASLSMTAHNDIDVNASITSTEGKLNVSLKAGRSVNVNASVSTNGGSFGTSVDPALIPEPEIDEVDEVEVAEEDPTEDVLADETIDDTTPEDEAGVESLVDGIEDTDEELVEETIAEVEYALSEVEEALDGDIIEEALAAIEITDTIETDGGSIEVDGGSSGDVVLSGTLDASNETLDAIGGDIDITGLDLVLEETAVVDASGDSGGGVIRIGGGRNGQDESIRNARSVVIEEGAEIHADAITDGDGGEVIVYGSDGITIDGEITARGGAEGGDGGFVETSSHGTLQINQVPTTAAPNGTGGEWLIDPTDYTLDAANWALLHAGLVANAVVTLQTTSSPNDPALLNGLPGTGNITTAAAFDYDGIGAGKTLRLFADEDILINQDIFDGDISRGSPDDGLTLIIRGDCTFNAASDSCTANGSGSVTFDASEGGLLIDTSTGLTVSELSVSGHDINFMGGDGANESLEIFSSGKQQFQAANDINITGGTGEDAFVNITLSFDELDESETDIRQSFLADGDINVKSGEGNVEILTDISTYEAPDGLLASQNFVAGGDLLFLGGSSGNGSHVVVDHLVGVGDALGSVDATQNFSGTNIRLSGGDVDVDGSGGGNGSGYSTRDAEDIFFTSPTAAVLLVQSSSVRGDPIDTSQNIIASDDLTLRGGDGIGAMVRVMNLTTFDNDNLTSRQNLRGNTITLQAGDGTQARVEVENLTYQLDDNPPYDNLDTTIELTATAAMKLLGGNVGNFSFTRITHNVETHVTNTAGEHNIDINAGSLEVLAGDGASTNGVTIQNVTIDNDPLADLDNTETANIDIVVTGDATFRGGQNPAGNTNAVLVQTSNSGHVRIEAGGDLNFEAGVGTVKFAGSALGTDDFDEEGGEFGGGGFGGGGGDDVGVGNSGDDVTISAFQKLKIDAGENVNVVSSATASVILEAAVSGFGSTIDINAGNELNLDNSAGGGNILIQDQFGAGTVNLTFTSCNPAISCTAGGGLINAGSTNTTVLSAAPAGQTTAALLEFLAGAAGEGIVFPGIGDLVNNNIVIDTSNLGLDDLAGQLVSLITTETLADEKSLAEELEDEDSEVRSSGLLCY